MQYTWQLALVLVPVYFIKHSVSCYIYYFLSRVCTSMAPSSMTCFVWWRLGSSIDPFQCKWQPTSHGPS